MTERVLTDLEARGAALGTWHSSTVPYPFNFQEVARAVEAATLAKIEHGKPRYWIDKDGNIGPFGNVVTAREARRRERAAWRKGFLKAWEDARACVREKAMFGSMLWDKDRQVPIMDAEFFNEEPEFIYPDVSLPTTKRARTVTLSDGGTVRSDLITDRPYGLAKTPADARALAELMERPFEEVSE